VTNAEAPRWSRRFRPPTRRRSDSLRSPSPLSWDVQNSLAWFLLAFAIFNAYMLLWSTRVSVAVFAVFATFEATEILLAIGFFREAHGDSAYMTHVGGWVAS
jgi:succinate-acetate transporter protein